MVSRQHCHVVFGCHAVTPSTTVTPSSSQRQLAAAGSRQPAHGGRRTAGDSAAVWALRSPALPRAPSVHGITQPPRCSAGRHTRSRRNDGKPTAPRNHAVRRRPLGPDYRRGVGCCSYTLQTFTRPRRARRRRPHRQSVPLSGNMMECGGARGFHRDFLLTYRGDGRKWLPTSPVCRLPPATAPVWMCRDSSFDRRADRRQRLIREFHLQRIGGEGGRPAREPGGPQSEKVARRRPVPVFVTLTVRHGKTRPAWHA